MKFLLVASDVIYPQGSMKDCVAKFYLPFKGFTKPIYAVPGNHDWYDALEAFSANFSEPEAARTAMRVRRKADGGLTSTTETRIEDMIAEARRLRHRYGVQCGSQHVPFLEIQTDRFSLLALDTGILRSLDPQRFDNGGGGAYISIGTSLDWPAQLPFADGAFYPRTDAVIAKLDGETPTWKQPLWWWVNRFGARPLSPEVLASAFASNRAPFFPSFVEVRVESSANVARILPHTAYRRMQWRDLQLFGHVGSGGNDPDSFVEFTLPLPAANAAE